MFFVSHQAASSVSSHGCLQQRSKQGQAKCNCRSLSTCNYHDYTTRTRNHGFILDSRDTAHKKEKVRLSYLGGLQNLLNFLLNRSQSQSVDGPPSTRRRSRSPSESDATHDVEPRSTKDIRRVYRNQSRSYRNFKI